MYEIQQASTDQTIYVHLKNSSTGVGQTGLVYNSSGAACRYTRPRAAATSITLATLASASTGHSDGGFVEVDATNARGLYRLDLPDAVVAAGASYAIVTLQFTGIIETAVLIRLPAFNPYDAVRMVLSALPNAAAAANGGLPTVNASNQVDISQTAADRVWSSTTRTLSAFAFLVSLASAEFNTIADAVLKRDMSAVTGAAARSPLNALRFLRNKRSIAAGVLTVTAEDDTTSAWTASITENASANPVTGIDPT